jgi:hypothetical protein
MRDIELCRASAADTALSQLRNPTAAANEAVELAEADLSAARRALERFEMALQAQAAVDAAQAKADSAQAVDDLVKRIEERHADLVGQTQALLAQIEGIGPRWLAVVQGFAELSDLTRSAVRASGATVRTDGLDGHDLLADAVACALARTGLGTSGPSLEPVVRVLAPSSMYHPKPITEALHLLQARRLDALARAKAQAGLGQQTEQTSEVA